MSNGVTLCFFSEFSGECPSLHLYCVKTKMNTITVYELNIIDHKKKNDHTLPHLMS